MRAPGLARLDWLMRSGTAGLRVLPSFLVIGAHKSGTTSMHALLRQHPAVLRPARKEVQFFDRDWARGLDHYRAHFPLRATVAAAGRRAGTPAITFESSPGYLLHPRVPRRVRGVLPCARFVVLLRNPTDRAYSAYLHAGRKGSERRPFDEALRAERQRVADDARGPEWAATLSFAYLARGRYLDHLDRWWSEFPRDRFLLVNSEDLYADPAGTAGRVYDFVGLPPFTPEDLQPRNQGDGPPIDADLQADLDTDFAEDNRRLFEETGIDFRTRAAGTR